MMAGEQGYDVFLSYAHTDGAAARQIAEWLSSQTLRTFFDRSELRAGLRWVVALEEAIGRAGAVALLIGSHGLGNTQQYERELALVRQTREPGFPVIPVVLPGCEEPPTGFLQLLTWVDLRGGASPLEQPAGLQALLAAIRREAVGSAAVRGATCPYMGLEPFREEDAAFFCGREAATRELVAKVSEHALVAVVGRSGSGKSSLVYAGLLPALRRQALDRQRASVVWDVVSFRPGKWPLRALAACFGVVPEGAGPARIDAYLEDEAEAYRHGDTGKLGRIVADRLKAAPERPDRLLIYVDQWEELYAMTPSADEAPAREQHARDVARFIELLLSATFSVGAHATVVLTVRADFYGPLIRHPGLSVLLPRQQVNLGPMVREDLRAAVLIPAERIGLRFEPRAVVEQVLEEVGTDEGMLPLLQYALKETWLRREGDRLTAKAYAEAGGVLGAIRSAAERAYAELTEDEKAAARRLFLGLVTPGEGREDTRARGLMPPDAVQRRVVERFADRKARLLVTGSEQVPMATAPGVTTATMRACSHKAAGGAFDDSPVRATVEVAHEALIRTWPTLRGWLDASREKLRARAAVLRQQREWEDNGRVDGLLLQPGFQLERGRSLLADPGDVRVDDLKDYVELSIRHDEKKVAAEREAALEVQQAKTRHEQELKEAAVKVANEQRRRAKIAVIGGIIACVFAVVAVAAVGATIFPLREARNAEHEALNAEQRAIQERDLATFAADTTKRVSGAAFAKAAELASITEKAVASNSPSDRANAYDQFALYHNDAGDWERARRAIQLADEILQGSSDDAAIAQHREAQGDMKWGGRARDGSLGALEYYAAALAHLDRSEDSATKRARVTRKMASELIKQEKLEEAAIKITEANAIIKNEPASPERAFLLGVSGQIGLARHDYSAAISNLQESVALFSELTSNSQRDLLSGLALGQTLQILGDAERKMGLAHAYESYDRAIRSLDAVLADDPTLQDALRSKQLARRGLRLLSMADKHDAETDVSLHRVNSDFTAAFRDGIGKFRWGMTSAEVNLLLKPPFDEQEMAVVPRAWEYKTSDIRYLCRFLGDAAPKGIGCGMGIQAEELTRSIFPNGPDCMVNYGYAAFMFYEDRLFRIVVRFHRNPNLCPAWFDSVDEFARRYRLLASGGYGTRRLQYETGNVGLVAFSDDEVVVFEFEQR